MTRRTMPPGRRARTAVSLAPPRLLRVAEVAELLGVCERTVRRLIAGGELRHHRIGHAVRVSEADLRAYLERAR